MPCTMTRLLTQQRRVRPSLLPSPQQPSTAHACADSPPAVTISSHAGCTGHVHHLADAPACICAL